MNIQVFREVEMPTDLTGGEYSTAEIGIYIDPHLPIRTQRLLVIHSIIENYCRSWAHDKVEELCEFIEDGIDQVEGIE